MSKVTQLIGIGKRGAQELLDVVSIRDAAEILCVSERTIYRMVDDGQLHLCKPRPRVSRIRLSEIKRLIDGAVGPSRCGGVA